MVFTGLLCLAAGRRITDGQTGFRAFSRRALECAEIIHDYNYAQVLTVGPSKERDANAGSPDFLQIPDEGEVIHQCEIPVESTDGDDKANAEHLTPPTAARRSGLCGQCEYV